MKIVPIGRTAEYYLFTGAAAAAAALSALGFLHQAVEDSGFRYIYIYKCKKYIYIYIYIC